MLEAETTEANMAATINYEPFVEHYKAVFNASKHTVKAYSFDLCDFNNYVVTTSTDIGKDLLREYIRHLRDERALKETTIKRRIACLKLYFRWALEEGQLDSNPFDGLNERIRLPKRLPRALAKEDARLLRRAIRCDPIKDTCSTLMPKITAGLLLTTGIRVGELVTIDLQSIDSNDASIRIIGKGNRQRIVYFFDPQLQRLLAHYLALRKESFPDVSNLLIDLRGKPLSTDKARLALLKIATSAQISRRVTPHMLRHTAATEWLEAGLDIRHVQKLLGHHSISTTEIYTHVSDSSLRGALLRATGGILA